MYYYSVTHLTACEFNRTVLYFILFLLITYYPVYYSLTLQLNIVVCEFNQTILYCITIHFFLYAIMFTTSHTSIESQDVSIIKLYFIS